MSDLVKIEDRAEQRMRHSLPIASSSPFQYPSLHLLCQHQGNLVALLHRIDLAVDVCVVRWEDAGIRGVAPREMTNEESYMNGHPAMSTAPDYYYTALPSNKSISNSVLLPTSRSTVNTDGKCEGVWVRPCDAYDACLLVH